MTFGMIDRVEKQILNTDKESIRDLFSKGFTAAKAREEVFKIQEIGQEINRDYLIYKTGNKKR